MNLQIFKGCGATSPLECLKIFYSMKEREAPMGVLFSVQSERLASQYDYRGIKVL